MALPDTSVVYFNSSMSGTSTISNTAGTVLSILNDCLVNGFGSVNVDANNGIVIADDVATVTVSGGHNFAMVGETGPVITIANAVITEGDGTGLNGRWRIASVPSSTTFTFATENISDQTATTASTITAKRSPAGFSQAFTGTNLCAYRSDYITGNRLYLRVDDTNNNYCRIRGYETMSDVNTGTGLFPTDAQLSGGLYIYKATSTSRAWTLFSDGQMIYFFCDPTGAGTWLGGFAFGDVIPCRSVDAYSSIIIGSATSNGVNNIIYPNNATGHYTARSFTQLGGSITHILLSNAHTSTYFGGGSMFYPSPVDFKAHADTIECWDSSSYLRGTVPGVYSPLHFSSASYFSQGMTLEGVAGCANKTIVFNCLATNYGLFIDCTGPWR